MEGTSPPPSTDASVNGDASDVTTIVPQPAADSDATGSDQLDQPRPASAGPDDAQPQLQGDGNVVGDADTAAVVVNDDVAVVDEAAVTIDAAADADASHVDTEGSAAATVEQQCLDASGFIATADTTPMDAATSSEGNDSADAAPITDHADVTAVADDAVAAAETEEPSASEAASASAVVDADPLSAKAADSAAAAAAAAPAPVLLEGPVRKRGEKGFRSFKQRHFVLTADRVEYRTAVNGDKRGDIVLSATSSATAVGGKGFHVLASGGRVFECEANTAEARDEWVAAITAAIADVATLHNASTLIREASAHDVLLVNSEGEAGVWIRTCV